MVMKVCELILAFLMILHLSCKEDNKTSSDSSTSQQRIIQANFKSFIDISWNEKNVDTLSHVLAKNYFCNHNGIRVAGDRNEMQAFMKTYFIGFPDARFATDATQIKDNRLFTNWTFKGTNTGAFRQMPATGKKIKITGYATVYFNGDGEIVQEDIYFNELEFLQQLGYTLTPPILK